MDFMCKFTPSHVAIREKLGWADMIDSVAIEAIDKIVNTACAQVEHATGDCVSFEEMARIMIDSWSSDTMFCMLADTEDFTLTRLEREELLFFRWEIETFSMKGCNAPYWDAINEWLK